MLCVLKPGAKSTEHIIHYFIWLLLVYHGTWCPWYLGSSLNAPIINSAAQYMKQLLVVFASMSHFQNLLENKPCSRWEIDQKLFIDRRDTNQWSLSWLLIMSFELSGVRLYGRWRNINMSLGASTGFRLQIRLNKLLLINLDWCYQKFCMYDRY